MLIEYILFAFILCLIGVILTHPAVCVAAAASGLMAWFNSVIPSLFPFMVLTGLLIRSGVLSALAQKLRHLPIINRLPIQSVFAVLTGLLCGYPMGVQTVYELKRDRQLSEHQARRLYSFVNQPGPMFILGYAMPLCNLSPRQEYRFILSFYGGVLFTALLVLLLSVPKRTTVTYPTPNIVIKSTQLPFISLFEDVLMSSMATLGKIGGYMMLFSLISALVSQLLPHLPTVTVTMSGLLEMTSGLSLLPALNENIVPYLALGFISFGGLSVTAQSISLGNLSSHEQLQYLLWKTIQTIICLCIWHFL